MIKAYQIRTEYSDSAYTFDVLNPGDSGLIIKSVTGITPVKASINLSTSASRNGSTYNSTTKNARNIVFTIGIQDGIRTVEENRHLLYNLFAIGSKLTLRIISDSRTGEIKGYVESNEIDVYVDDENAVISIICPTPDIFDVKTKQELFEPLDESDLYYNCDIQYKGDVITGCDIIINVLEDSVNGTFSLYHMLGEYDGRITIDASKIKIGSDTGFKKYDQISISSYKGAKYIMLYRSSSINILKYVERNPCWIYLLRGDNTIQMLAKDVKLKASVKYTEVYEGV